MRKKPIVPFITVESVDFFRDVNWGLRCDFVILVSGHCQFFLCKIIITGLRIISIVVKALLHNAFYNFGVLLRRAQSCVAGGDAFREIKLE
jgi:hypothetical protein